MHALAPADGLSREAVFSIGDWALLLNNARHGTDVGVVPSLAARELGVRGIRAVCGDHALILEVFGQDGDPPLLSRRSIADADDDGRVFETSGKPYPFEPEIDRFTCETLYGYLRALGVPYDAEPDWAGGFLLEKPRRRKFRLPFSL